MMKLLQFGAGKIGRSFIAQLFSRAGYEIVFADIDPCLVKQLNEAGEYHVHIKGNFEESSYTVRNVSAFEIGSDDDIATEIADADVVSVSVGKKSLLDLAGILARGVRDRYNYNPDNCLDIILAENVRNAGELLSREMQKFLGDFPLSSYVGFVETSIGKMVPLMTKAQLEEDPLSIFAEPYNELILDASGFRNEIPAVPQLNPKQNMKAWVDRKIFIHNLGHAALAYHANYDYPELTYTWEALEKEKLLERCYETMIESAAILAKLYPDEFSKDELRLHVLDLLSRFSNKALGDTIFRVGSDLARKLGPEDRLLFPALIGQRMGMKCNLIMEAWVKGCSFDAKNEEGKILPADRKFISNFQRDPFRILREHCKLNPLEIKDIFRSVEKIFARLPEKKLL